jgi:GNAT superfamily N-acetyltransferase
MSDKVSHYQEFTHRLATRNDFPAVRALMDVAIGELLLGYLDARQIAASRAIMGLDTQLVEDKTYFLVEHEGTLVGCGSWSRRATLFGSDATVGRNAALLNPGADAARVRAMYTHPSHVRRGVGRLILRLCEDAARDEGFRRLELMATVAGEPLYRACGFKTIEQMIHDQDGVAIPLVRMEKVLSLGL